eukprot:1553342-Pyramimonas_sp.AAC.1
MYCGGLLISSSPSAAGDEKPRLGAHPQVRSRRASGVTQSSLRHSLVLHNHHSVTLWCYTITTPSLFGVTKSSFCHSLVLHNEHSDTL